MPQLTRAIIGCLVIFLLAATTLAQDSKPPKKKSAKSRRPAAASSNDDAQAAPATDKVDKVEDKKEATKEEAAEVKAADEAKPDAAAEKPAETAKTESAAAAKTESAAAAKPATVKAARQPVKVEVSLTGVLEAKNMTEISVRPKVWSELKVRKAVAHGTEVGKGDVLVEFETEKIDNALADRRSDQRLARLALEQAERDLEALQATTPMDLKLAERSKRIMDEDFARYQEIDKPLSEKSAKYSLDTARNSLEYEQEELKQLEKMYEADDLTEETEEIVLKRQRDAVRRAEFMVELAEARYEETLKLSIPRQEESLKDTVERTALATEKAKATLPQSLEQARIALEKQKVVRARSDKDLARLEADRELMEIASPTDGVVYYGRSVRGQWSGASAAADDLRPGGDITSGEVFMTIVEPRPIFVRATVDEKNLHWIKPGLEAVVQPAGYPDLKLDATVSEVDSVPSSSGKFEAKLKLKLVGDADDIMPGMTCTAKLLPYVRREALVVPASAVFADEIDSDKQFVYMAVETGKPKKQAVVVGQKSGDKVEILEGLEDGDEILAQKPEEKK